MPIRIALRQGADNSPFRRMLDSLIQAPLGDSIMLCSGYVQEDPLGSFRILDDLLPMIKASTSLPRIVTVAGKLSGNWSDSYRHFVDRLRAAGMQIDAFYAPRRNWHAKIALRIDQNDPVAGIVGSSNLTRPAFDAPYHGWNFEADVLIWKPSTASNLHFRNLDLVGSPGPGIIDAILDPDIPQLDEGEQLRSIHRHILSSDLQPLPR